MARTQRENPPKDAEIPTSFAEVPPTGYPHTVEMGYIVENLLQIQNTLGGLREAVDSLKTASHVHTAKLENINKVIFSAGIVLVVVLSVAGFFLNKIWDILVAALRGVGHAG
jgi:hypothetical protein